MNEIEVGACFTPEDLVASPKIVEIVSCAKSAKVAYCIKEFNIEKQKSYCNIFLHDAVKKVSTQLTRASPGVQCYNPQFITDYGVGTVDSLCFMREGQVWNIPTLGGEAVQLTHLPLDISSYRVFINEYDQLFMMVVLNVYSDKTIQETVNEDSKTPTSSAMEFNSLMVRHWDTWDVYKKRNHLFLIPLDVTEDGLLSTAATDAGPLDLMRNWESDCTGKAPGQGEEDYAISPDGFTLAFACRAVVPEKNESIVSATSGVVEYTYKSRQDMAWTTDTNIYTINLPKHRSDFSKFQPVPNFACNCCGGCCGMNETTEGAKGGFRYQVVAARCCNCCCKNSCQNDQKRNDMGSGNYAPIFSPSGRYILYGCRERAQFESDKGKLKVFDVSSGSTVDLTVGIDLGCDAVEWEDEISSKENMTSSTLSFFVNAQYHGAYRIFRFVVECSHTDTGSFNARVTHIDVMQGDNGVVSPKLVKGNGKSYLYFLESSLLAPPELKMSTLDTTKVDDKLFSSFHSNNTDGLCVTNSSSSTVLSCDEISTGCVVPLTQNESRYMHTVHVPCPKFTNNDIAMPSHAEKHYFKGGNNEWVQAWYLPPVLSGFDASTSEHAPGSIPLVLIIHGGPQGAILNQWHYRWNMAIFAALGYGVVAINFHGSTGFGQDFTDSISGDWSGKPYQDIILGVKYILNHHSYLDSNRVAALGASYGGYMINWLNGHNPDNLFKVLVNHDGVFNNVAMYFSTEELWFSGMVQCI